MLLAVTLATCQPPPEIDACLAWEGAPRDGLHAFAGQVAVSQQGPDGAWSLVGVDPDVGDPQSLVSGLAPDARRIPGGVIGTRQDPDSGRWALVRIRGEKTAQLSGPHEDVLGWFAGPEGAVAFLAARPGEAIPSLVLRQAGKEHVLPARRLWGTWDTGAVFTNPDGQLMLARWDGNTIDLGPSSDAIDVTPHAAEHIADGVVTRAVGPDGAPRTPAAGRALPGASLRLDGTVITDAQGRPLLSVDGAHPRAALPLSDGRFAVLVAHDTDRNGRDGLSDEADLCVWTPAEHKVEPRDVPSDLMEARDALLAAAEGMGVTLPPGLVQLHLDGATPGDVAEAERILSDQGARFAAIVGEGRAIEVLWEDGRGTWAKGVGHVDAHGVRVQLPGSWPLDVTARVEWVPRDGTVAMVRWAGAVTATDAGAVAVTGRAASLVGAEPHAHTEALGPLEAGARRPFFVTLDMVDTATHPNLELTFTVNDNPVAWRDALRDEHGRAWWRTVAEARALGFVDRPHRDGLRLPGRIEHDLPAFDAPDGFDALPEAERNAAAAALYAILDGHFRDLDRRDWLGARIQVGDVRYDLTREGLRLSE